MLGAGWGVHVQLGIPAGAAIGGWQGDFAAACRIQQAEDPHLIGIEVCNDGVAGRGGEAGGLVAQQHCLLYGDVAL